MNELQTALLNQFISNSGQLVNSSSNNTYDCLRSISFILQDDYKLAESAIDVLDHIQYITHFKSRSSERNFFIVPGSQGKDYICMGNYCSCPSYMEIIKHPTQSKKHCKHLVVIKIAKAFDKCKDIVS